jgi:hypothetical protein
MFSLDLQSEKSASDRLIAEFSGRFGNNLPRIYAKQEENAKSSAPASNKRHHIRAE